MFSAPAPTDRNVCIYALAETIILTYRYRIKDGSSSTKRALRKQARAVNFVWNYLCEIDRETQHRYKAGMKVRRLSAYDLGALCRGISKELGIHSDTIDELCNQFLRARKGCFPKTPRFRSCKRYLDWIPFSTFVRPAKLEGSVLKLQKRRYHLWLSRRIPENGKPKSWNISADSRGRWYVNIHVELPKPPAKRGKPVGIDLGVKTLATLSSGETFGAPGFYRRSEKLLAQFQRRKQKARARALRAKITLRRRHFLHVVSTKITREFSEIYVGDVSSSQLAKTRMAKCVYDAGWSMLRGFLSYKAIAQGGRMHVVPERLTTQTCSSCGSVGSSNRPVGIARLGIRAWTCSDCGASHDRDVNAAKNILRLGLEHGPLAEGIRHIEFGGRC